MNKKVIFSTLIAIILLLTSVSVYAQQNQNNLETRIEIKIEGEINELQKTKINELLNYFENQNPRLKIDSKIIGERPEGPEKAEGARLKMLRKFFCSARRSGAETGGNAERVPPFASKSGMLLEKGSSFVQ